MLRGDRARQEFVYYYYLITSDTLITGSDRATIEHVNLRKLCMLLKGGRPNCQYCVPLLNFLCGIEDDRIKAGHGATKNVDIAFALLVF